jgi:iron complex outermembrane recepter protein
MNFQTILFALALLTLTLPLSLHGENRGSVAGYVIDAETEEPIPFAYIHLEEINRTATTDRHGYFKIHNVPAGRYTLFVHRIGFRSKSTRIDVHENDETTVTIDLTPTVLSGQSIEVVADAGDLRGSNLEHASIKVTGAQLRKNLGATLSETLSSQPGFEQRTMGAAPARPVIRGLGDERVLILQDGERTGDVSGSSPDHSVTVDPLGANEIEIARGPAALAYGSNAIGGVINVVRNQIANNMPSSTTGVATLQGSSVNSGLSAAGMITVPKNDFVINADLTGRYGSEYRSPEGRIDNSNYLTANGALGVSYIQPWGYTGLAASSFVSNYGIPPDPEGGHPSGVDVEMQKFQVESKTEYLIQNSFFKLLEGQLSYRYYNHKEIEASGAIGSEFTLNSANLNLKAHHRSISFLDDGVIGIWGEFQDYFVFDRFNIESNSYSGSVFTIQEADFGPFHLELGARLDAVSVVPKQEMPNSRIGHIRQRDFLALASSAALIYDIGVGFSVGTSFIHSFRAPSMDELFSRGPHIAAYSFEIGNPDLDPERGLGKEIFLRYRQPNLNIELSGYHNKFSNYIYPRDTGEQNIFFPRLNDYQFTGTEARLYGFEASAELQILSNWTVNGSTNMTIGEKVAEDDPSTDWEPLPMIPPLTVGGGVTYVNGPFSAGGTIRHSFKQDRLAEFETVTDAYTLLGLNVEYRYTSNSNMLHTFSLNVNNLLNEEYRNHLSRLKDVFPEPGRNLSLLYRLYF